MNDEQRNKLVYRITEIAFSVNPNALRQKVLELFEAYPETRVFEWCDNRMTQILDRINLITQGQYTVCAWDSMERPHVTQGAPEGGHCSGKYDLPRTKEDAEFYAAAPADIGYLIASIANTQAEKHLCYQERLDLSRVVETLENERDLLVAQISELKGQASV